MFFGYKHVHCPGIKTKDIYKYIAEDVEKWFDTSNSGIGRSLPLGKNKKVFGLMKDKFCGQIMRKNLRSKTYSYLKENNDEGKKSKSIKSCVIKRQLRFKDYKKCLKIFRILDIINCLERKG